MATGEDRDQEFLDRLILTDDHLGQFAADVFEGLLGLGDEFLVVGGGGGLGIA